MRVGGDRDREQGRQGEGGEHAVQSAACAHAADDGEQRRESRGERGQTQRESRPGVCRHARSCASRPRSPLHESLEEREQVRRPLVAAPVDEVEREAVHDVVALRDDADAVGAPDGRELRARARVQPVHRPRTVEVPLGERAPDPGRRVAGVVDADDHERRPLRRRQPAEDRAELAPLDRARRLALRVEEGQHDGASLAATRASRPCRSGRARLTFGARRAPAFQTACPCSVGSEGSAAAVPLPVSTRINAPPPAPSDDGGEEDHEGKPQPHSTFPLRAPAERRRSRTAQ